MISTFIITSPSPQYSEIVRSVASELDFQAIIIEAILEDAVDLVLEQCRLHEIAAIISRGSTAVMIRNSTDIPVLSAEASDFDVLISILDSVYLSAKIAYVQYNGNTIEELPRLLKLLNINVKQYYFTTKEEMRQAIEQAAQDQMEVVVCGSAQGQQMCEAIGLKSVCVNTSRRTIKEIIYRAKLIKYVRDRDMQHQNQLRTTLNLIPEGIIYIDIRNIITLINAEAMDILEIDKDTEVMGKPITDLMPSYEFINIINERNEDSAHVIDFSGKPVLVRSVPVFANENYIGSVLSFQKTSYVSKLDHKIRLQALAHGMTASARFEDLEKTSCSQSMKNCIEKAKLYAQTDSTILIIGESGTGKEMFAQSIHNLSARHNQPFVAINCAALPKNLLESELFGYEEGAFTGALRGGKPGYFELAHNGTLFLDELGLLPLQVQMQLLRVLQERKVMRIGSDKMIPINVRIIAATNSDLAMSVKNGTFRQDLYFRLNVLNITIPPLRNRIDDIPYLIRHYISLFSAQYNKNIHSCSSELIYAFQQHNWPGNVRELMNYLMRIVILSEDETLTLDVLGKCDINNLFPIDHSNKKEAIIKEETTDKSEKIQLVPSTMEKMELDIIQWYMDHYNGNKKEVCEALKICRTTLWKRLNKISETTDKYP